jgi:hypothetical protein
MEEASKKETKKERAKCSWHKRMKDNRIPNSRKSKARRRMKQTRKEQPQKGKQEMIDRAEKERGKNARKEMKTESV